jgi:hypothetical protein
MATRKELVDSDNNDESPIACNDVVVFVALVDNFDDLVLQRVE